MADSRYQDYNITVILIDTMLIKNIYYPLTLLSGILLFFSCHSDFSSQQNNISSDSTVIDQGEALFTLHCSGCHNIYQNGIGPALAGITTEVSADWLLYFIQHPEESITSGDERATQLYKKYKTIMPSFASLKEAELNALIAFLHTHQSASTIKREDSKGITDPIPERIIFDGMVLDLTEIAKFPVTSEDGNPPLARITKLDFQPENHNLFVLDLNGILYKIKDEHPIPYLDVRKLKQKFIHKPGLATGFGSFAFHPNFQKNGLLYTTHTEPPRTLKAEFGYADSIKSTVQWVLTEWKVTDHAVDRFAGTSRELFRADMVSGIHGVQEIAFNPSSQPGEKDYGLLYIGVGDGGCVENGYPALSQSREKIWGTILRIDPAGRNSANGKYGIPSSNPFATDQNSKIPGEIYAFGFRNPHRISWTKSGSMLVCNIGQRHIESVNLVHPGNDYGWPIREGHFLINPQENIDDIFPLPADDSLYRITYPVAEFDHDEGAAISGGLEYLGNTLPRLKEKFIFGDIPSGRLFYINTTDIQQGKLATIKEWRISINGKLTTLIEACRNNRVDLHFGRDAEGELYILTKADGKLYKLTGVNQSIK